MNFKDSDGDEHVPLSSLMMKSNVKSKNKGVVDGNQGRKKVRNSKTFSASSGDFMECDFIVGDWTLIVKIAEEMRI
ncbi:hypothetical protein PIB30_043414 [Stylosanthes scabra]|uniref:Uncharacterized protein n=1 Tax=Stylosanthes scabra TaxID=79078 RepID=A0ABU6TGG6_9FABA|nr:hypothetical protein [Stylosanthes scabra]